jgi:hypothetical protein
MPSLRRAAGRSGFGVKCVHRCKQALPVTGSTTPNVGTAVLSVVAERGVSIPTTGRYLVLRDGRAVALADAQELIAGAPTVALASVGDPSVVILSTYTGGQGIPAYYLKLLVLSADASSAFTLSSETVGEIPSDVVTAFDRTGPGQFSATLWGGAKVTHRNGQLEVAPSNN